MNQYQIILLTSRKLSQVYSGWIVKMPGITFVGHVSYGGTPKYLVALHFPLLFLIQLVASEPSLIQS